MMKKNRVLRLMPTAMVLLYGVSLFAQEEIILDPFLLTPDPEGYYVAGVWKDKDDNGEDEFYNECIDEYSDSHHNESGMQQGFTYHNCMIMPTCYPKDADADHSLAEIDHPEGYIELTKTLYHGTDSAVEGYIISPPVEHLVSIYLETSPDVSSSASRHIYYYIEYSKDNGATWEFAYIKDETVSKKGDAHTYDGSLFLQFEDMKNASNEGPILLRIMSDDQRVKIHYLKIVADASSAVQHIRNDVQLLRIEDNIIYSELGEIEVFSITGRFIGKGPSVVISENQIYIVKSKNGAVRKIIVP
jgi:hypothetical protein